jgi:hypothetical protein
MEKSDEREKLPISQSTIENATFWSIFLSATEKTQQPFLSRTIKKTSLVFKVFIIFIFFKQLTIYLCQSIRLTTTSIAKNSNMTGK